MYKTIAGKYYNTDSAKRKGAYNAPKSKHNSQFFAEELYQKRTGEFFLYCTGNPKSKYGCCKDGVRYKSERIIPLSFAQAKEWALKFLPVALYEEIFGALKPLALSKKQLKAIETAASVRKLSPSTILDEVIAKVNEI